MAYQLAGLWGASPGKESLAELSPRHRAQAEAYLLRALEHLHNGIVTDAQRHEMGQSLAEHMAASDVLRRFSLGNDDPPCFVRVPYGGSGND